MFIVDPHSLTAYIQAHSSSLYAVKTISHTYAQPVNELAMINRLPFELLAKVFVLIDHDDRLAGSLVCQHWRAIATSTRFLWQHLQIAVPRQPYDLQPSVETLLARAENRPHVVLLKFSS